MGVAQIITDTWPRTEQELLTGTQSAGLDYAGAKLRAIDAAVAEVWLDAGGTPPAPSTPTIDASDLVVQQYVAYTALKRLIPMARDMYMQGKISSTQNYQPGGSGSDTTYNKLTALGDLEDFVDAEIARVKRHAVVILVPAPVVVAPVYVPTYFGLAKGRRY